MRDFLFFGYFLLVNIEGSVESPSFEIINYFSTVITSHKCYYLLVASLLDAPVKKEQQTNKPYGGIKAFRDLDTMETAC